MALKKYHGWIVQKIFQVSRSPPRPPRGSRLRAHPRHATPSCLRCGPRSLRPSWDSGRVPAWGAAALRASLGHCECSVEVPRPRRPDVGEGEVLATTLRSQGDGLACRPSDAAQLLTWAGGAGGPSPWAPAAPTARPARSRERGPWLVSPRHRPWAGRAVTGGTWTPLGYPPGQGWARAPRGSFPFLSDLAAPTSVTAAGPVRLARQPPITLRWARPYPFTGEETGAQSGSGSQGNKRGLRVYDLTLRVLVFQTV